MAAKSNGNGMAEKLAPKTAPPTEPPPKTQGVVNLWRSTRTMQIWCEVQRGNYRLRGIGEELTLLLMTGEKADTELLRWSAPRTWWDEQLRLGWQMARTTVNAAGIIVPRETLLALLADLDAKRPALLATASTLAAATQANMEAEKSEQPDALRVVEPHG